MKKKNGFISTSVIYSFFLIFVTLFLALILNYMHSRMLLNKINESAQNDINKIKNARIANLNIGDYVLFELKADQHDGLNEVTYILANKYDEGGNTIYEFYSPTNTLSQTFNSGTEFISINKFNNRKDIYKSYYKYSDINSNISLSILDSNSLKRVRDNITETNLLNNIYNTDTDYVVFNNISGTPYNENEYYNMRKYSFSSDNPNIIESYCKISYTSDTLSYSENNKFGYGNVLTATLSTPKYINYCYYANPENYTHQASDGVVQTDETIPSDLIPNNNSQSDTQDEVNQKNLFYRLVIRLSLNGFEDKDFFNSGKGTKEDPYVLREGSKE